MTTLTEVELDIQKLQLRRSAICAESTCVEGAEYAALMKELTSIERKLVRRYARRANLRAQRHASGFGFIGDYSRG